jgi:hypothetical protein
MSPHTQVSLPELPQRHGLTARCRTGPGGRRRQAVMDHFDLINYLEERVSECEVTYQGQSMSIGPRDLHSIDEPLFEELAHAVIDRQHRPGTAERTARTFLYWWAGCRHRDRLKARQGAGRQIRTQKLQRRIQVIREQAIPAGIPAKPESILRFLQDQHADLAQGENGKPLSTRTLQNCIRAATQR